MKFALFLALFVGLVAADGTEKRGKCPNYYQEIKNSENQVKCIPLAGSCVGSPDFVNIACFVSPCQFLPTNECPEVAHCYEDACNVCKPHYYDAQYNEVCQRQ
ncbi:hypothetical protein M3Y98_00082200 [Aphelenchoides besseyi]|nr:hypothetical protein M3Y98_00082200 [Aphelenchoides besseyi]KAI6198640.1 hypothetical protein M3Y96_00540700 [Aphelenchoides besseyi]